MRQNIGTRLKNDLPLSTAVGFPEKYRLVTGKFLNVYHI